MGTINLHDWKECRRLRAGELKPQGWVLQDIAAALDVSKEVVRRWLHRVRDAGVEARLSPPASGPVPKRTAAQKEVIPEFLWHGAEAYGFSGDVWTCARIARVIEQEFGVHYHQDPVGRPLKELCWTPQVPIKRAIQRDEPAIERGPAEVWPGVQERARRERRTLVFVYESGFYLLPGVVKTYAPKGQTPVLRSNRELEELHQEFHQAVGRLREKPQMIQSFFAQAGLTLKKS